MTLSSQVAFRSGAIINARIRTLAPALPYAEAVSWQDGRITAVGSTADVLEQFPNGAETIDLAGATLTPGLIDSHFHPTWGG